jgi:hypothetical protein
MTEVLTAYASRRLGQRGPTGVRYFHVEGPIQRALIRSFFMPRHLYGVCHNRDRGTYQKGKLVKSTLRICYLEEPQVCLAYYEYGRKTILIKSWWRGVRARQEDKQARKAVASTPRDNLSAEGRSIIKHARALERWWRAKSSSNRPGRLERLGRQSATRISGWNSSVLSLRAWMRK